MTSNSKFEVIQGDGICAELGDLFQKVEETHKGSAESIKCSELKESGSNILNIDVHFDPSRAWVGLNYARFVENLFELYQHYSECKTCKDKNVFRTRILYSVDMSFWNAGEEILVEKLSLLKLYFDKYAYSLEYVPNTVYLHSEITDQIRELTCKLNSRMREFLINSKDVESPIWKEVKEKLLPEELEELERLSGKNQKFEVVFDAEKSETENSEGDDE